MPTCQQDADPAEPITPIPDNDASTSNSILVQANWRQTSDLGAGSHEQYASSTFSIGISHYTTAASSFHKDLERSEDGPQLLHRIPSGPLYSVFTGNQKLYIVIMAAIGCFFSPLSANIYFPALNAIAKDLHVSNALINLTLTSYMIFQGIAPSIFGDLGDMLGRRPAYILGFIIYIGANVGLALHKNYAALLILRCVQSTGSSGTMALGSGVLADIASSGERGKYGGYVNLGAFAAPAIGPVLGGILTQFLGWQAIFWFLTIAAVAYMVPFCLTFPETGRNVVGNGSIPPQGWNMSLLNYMKTRSNDDGNGSAGATKEEKKAARSQLASQRKLRCPNPMKTLHIVAEKDVSIILFYNAIIYTAFYTILTSLPSLFAEIYKLNNLWIGLCFLPYGIGSILASILAGYLLDYNYKRVARKAGFPVDIKKGDDMKNFPLERARIQVVWGTVYVGIAAFVAYGWALQQNAPPAISLILTFIIALSFTGAYTVMSTMLVDLYPQSPSTATAANNLCRCLMGAGGTAVIIEMIERLGRGWCFTLIAGIVYMTSPLLCVVTKRGPKWREERRVRIETLKREVETSVTETEISMSEDIEEHKDVRLNSSESSG